ncbi:MAG: efflux transporter outer membrane subunit [Simkaniaceae bacterium]|nr:efflux transporter outer membrane subunit [Simkaniaceae bacterium]MCF7852381.1 efflux transporter outer membrane subunit [Simkaniaceae bacterium]
MKKISFLILLLLFTSCSFKPKYERPEMAIPSQWRTPSDIAPQDSNVAWWKELNDPMLDRYIEEALAYNQNIKQAVAVVDEYIARLGIVRSQLYPQIQGQAGAMREKMSETLISLPFGITPISNVFDLILNASYEVDIWGKIRNASDAAQSQLLASIENRRTVVLSIVSAVAAAYIDLCSLDMQLNISKQTKTSREESYYLAIVRFELGLTSKIQVQQALSEVESADAAIIDLEREIALKEDLLSILLGKPPQSIERGKVLSQLAMPIKIPTYLPFDIMSQRPDVIAAEQSLMAANANIGVAKARFFPDLSLAGAFGTETSALDSLFKGPSSVWQYGATLLQEIFTGGRLTSGLRLSRAQKMQMLHNYEETILNAFKEVNDALIAHEKSLELVDVQRDRTFTLAEYYRLANLRYQDGQTDYLTFLDAERQYFNAEIDYAKSLGNSFLTLVDVYKSLGGGWVIHADQEMLNGL